MLAACKEPELHTLPHLRACQAQRRRALARPHVTRGRGVQASRRPGVQALLCCVPQPWRSSRPGGCRWLEAAVTSAGCACHGAGLGPRAAACTARNRKDFGRPAGGPPAAAQCEWIYARSAAHTNACFAALKYTPWRATPRTVHALPCPCTCANMPQPLAFLPRWHVPPTQVALQAGSLPAASCQQLLHEASLREEWRTGREVRLLAELGQPGSGLGALTQQDGSLLVEQLVALVQVGVAGMRGGRAGTGRDRSVLKNACGPRCLPCTQFRAFL